MMQIIRDEAPDANTINPTVSPGLKAIIERCLRKRREERYATAGELSTALEQQLGRATTAPYTQQQTVRKTALPPPPAAPTEIVAQQPSKRSSSKWLWLSLLIVLLGVAIVAAIATRLHKPTPAPSPADAQAAPATTSSVRRDAAPPAAETAALPSTSTVSVTAPPQEQPVGKVTETEAPPPTQPQPQPSAPVASSPTIDDLYQQAVSRLASGDKAEARRGFLEVLKQDERYAKAHFRLGEIAVLNHNLGYARSELELAWGDKEKLDPRERHLTRLCMALSNSNRFEAQRVGMEIERQWPGDPDVAAIREAYPPEERPFRGRRFRP